MMSNNCGQNMKANFQMIVKMEKELYIYLMDSIFRDILLMILLREKESILLLME